MEEMKNEEMKPDDKKDCKCSKDGHACTKVSYQYADVSVPIKIKPFARVGKIDTKCCGESIVQDHRKEDGSCHGVCDFVITQAICVKIPIEYCVLTDIGDNEVHCGAITQTYDELPEI